jgi:hypothetical protein
VTPKTAAVLARRRAARSHPRSTRGNTSPEMQFFYVFAGI